MAKYVFIYHGGTSPDSPEDTETVMNAWMAWFGAMGDAVVDGGAPFETNQTVSGSGVSDGGGANPATGYTIVTADSMESAVALAQGCPILDQGTVEVALCQDMGG